MDHGLTFPVEDKLRTLLWGWLGEALSEDKRDGVVRAVEALDGELGRQLTTLLGAEEIGALTARLTQLLNDGRLPAPTEPMPALLWPPIREEAASKRSDISCGRR